MGSVGLGNNALFGAFQNKTFQEGLDLGRCVIDKALGIHVAAPAATFRAGMLVMRNSSGLLEASDGTDFLGVAKWNRATSMVGIVADEAVVLNGTTASNLAHANVSNVMVAASPSGVGDFTVTTDYTVNATNGTVTRVALGSIGDGDTVYVTYSFALTQLQLTQQQGLNFWNTLDETSQADDRVAVITEASMLFTAAYDTSVPYELNDNLYAATTNGKEGLFTSDNTGSAVFVGRVLQLPTASDPYLGLRLNPGLFAI
jgi:hypothetical protein